MNTQLFLLLLIIPFSLYAQNHTPFDFLEASRAANKVNESLNQINGRYGGQPAKNCSRINGPEGEGILTCSVRDEDFDNSLILKINYTPETLPSELKEKFSPEFNKKTENKKINCVFRFTLTNDNQQMLGRMSEQKAKNDSYGDDFGRTHSLGVGISCLSEDGINSVYTYSTELYSNPDIYTAQREASGNISVKQKFTSENIFSLIKDNINQNKATYWKKGVGFINLSQKDKWGFLQSTGQQKWFHNKINSIRTGSAYDYTNEEGSADSWGAFVMLSVGLQVNRQFGDRCKLNLNADAGGRLANLKQSTINLNAAAKLSYQIFGDGDVYLSAQSEVTRRPGSTVTENTLAVGYETSTGGFIQLGVTQQNGNRTDVPDSVNRYTNKNDYMISAKIGYSY